MQEISSDRYIEQSNGNGKNGQNGIVPLYPMPVLGQVNLEEDEDSIDLKHLLDIAKHRFRLIIAVALGITTLATIWTLIQKPKYEGNFQVLVEPVNKELKESQLAFLGGNLGGVDYSSQIEVLRSPSVLNPLLDKLATRYPEIEYADLIQEKNSPLEIEQSKATKILNISYQDSDPDQVQFVLENLAQVYLQYSLEEKRKEIERGIEFVRGELPKLTHNVDEVQARLEKFRQKHNLLNPEEYALLIAEQLTQQEQKYFETQVQIKEAKSLYDNLQRQLGLEPQQALVASYLSESPRYQNLLDRLQEVNVSLARESARFLPTSPNIIELKEQREKLLPLLEQEAARILGRNLMGALSADTSPLDSPSSLRLELSQQYIETANTIETLELRRRSLEGDITSLKKLAAQIPGIARQYAELMRELTVANQSLARFLESEEELKIEIARQSVPWQIIAQTKVEEDPVAPKPVRDISLGLIAGTLLGVAAALIAEKLDPVFHSPEEITEMTNLPILGKVPVQKDLKPRETAQKVEVSLSQLQTGDTSMNVPTPGSHSQHHSYRNNWSNTSPFLEAFPFLNTNIRLLRSDSILNSIAISSSIPSEGKSTIATHLAQAAAAMGQKVLIIDTDLRRPQVHRWMGLPNTEGLSNILTTDLEVEAAIQKVPQWENLFVISAGDIPPEPTRLLCSQKMQELMEKLKHSHNYDLIIYDTPPILGFAEGRILATRTNGVVLVVRMGKTDRSLLKQNVDTLRMSNVSVLGIVANQVNRSNYSVSSY